MKKKLKIVITIIVLLAIAGGVTAYFLLKGDDDDAPEGIIYVEDVKNIVGTNVSVDSRYMGVVESQETKNVNPDSDKKVKTLYVKAGDAVKKGDILFEYDTDAMQLKLRQLQLELQNINNGITSTNQQIAELVKERDEAPAENKIEYSAQIQNLQAQVNQSNYDASSKQLEIDRQQAAMENNKVVSPMDGTVKEINESVAEAAGSESEFDYNNSSNGNNEKAYITIMATGDLRIKGTASEMNVRSMSNGQSVIVHSRLDETLTWKGTIKSIDLEHTENNNSEYMYGGSGETTSNYPFYIELENTDGLILGEHVYIEMDYGQTEAKSGLWLNEFFVVQDAGGAYVWAENSKGRIEKREVQLGEYDSELMRYEILAGITTDDYIAFPEDRFKEGMKTTHSYDELLKYEEEMGGSDEKGVDDPEAGQDPDAMGVDDPEAGQDPDAMGVDDPEAGQDPDAMGVDDPEAGQDPDAMGVDDPEAGQDPDAVESPDGGELPSGEEAE